MWGRRAERRALFISILGASGVWPTWQPATRNVSSECLLVCCLCGVRGQRVVVLSGSHQKGSCNIDKHFLEKYTDWVSRWRWQGRMTFFLEVPLAFCPGLLPGAHSLVATVILIVESFLL